MASLAGEVADLVHLVLARGVNPRLWSSCRGRGGVEEGMRGVLGDLFEDRESSEQAGAVVPQQQRRTEDLPLASRQSRFPLAQQRRA